MRIWIQIQGFDVKIWKICLEKNPFFTCSKIHFLLVQKSIFYLFKNCNGYLSLGSYRWSPSYHRTIEAFSPQKITANTSKREILVTFFYFCGSFLPFWIRNRIPSAGSGSSRQKSMRIRIRNTFLYEYYVFARQRSDGNQQARTGFHAGGGRA